MSDQDEDSSSALGWLLQPRSLREFARDYYERAPLHVARNRPEYYRDVFSLAEFERILYGGEVLAEDLRVAKDGLPARKEAYVRPDRRRAESTREVIDSDRVSALFAGGCSLVFETVPSYSASVARLCRELETWLEHRANANVYLTPPNSQGFSVHYDTHDTVILQIEGTKHWHVYGSGTTLPLLRQPYDKKVHTARDLSLESLLTPGDLLYIPRGVMHEAKASDAYSLHVTLGLFPILWADVVREALEHGCDGDEILRSGASRLGGVTASAVPAALERAFSERQLVAARQRLADKFAGERRNGLEGQLQQILRLNELSPASHVALRGDALYRVHADAAATTLVFSGKTVRLPAGAAPVVRALENAPFQTLEALLALEPKALEIVRRLIKEGFALQIFGSATPFEAAAQRSSALREVATH